MQSILTVLALAPAVALGFGVDYDVEYSNGWSKQEQVRASLPVSFTVVVNEQGADEIVRIAKEVSNPDHPKYGKYLSAAQLNAIVAPTATDMNAVTAWLDGAEGVSYEHVSVSNLKVTATAAAASKLLSTKFHRINHRTQGDIVRAAGYTIPSEVHRAITTIFGLHGLPLPVKATATAATAHRGLRVGPMPHKPPANVTPAVIYKTYNVKYAKAARSDKNRQAVAEFQGQFMNSSDLAKQFSEYVTAIDPDYEVGTDDVVSKWVGKHTENSGGVEAELDIQFMMGVTPGIKTEFWEFPGMDFGADLNQWTGNLTSGDDVPMVHSVSYGWQGNLSQIHVKNEDVKAIDANLVKMAAKGISVMISSGDSGSGYSTPNMCEGTGSKGVGIDGTVEMSMEAEEVMQCCEEAQQRKAKGWTFVPHKHKGPDKQLSLPKLAGGSVVFAPNGSFSFKDAIFHDMQEGPCGMIGPGPKPTKEGCPPFETRDVFVLNGDLTADGGEVKVTCKNGTLPDTTITFSAEYKREKGSPEMSRNISGTFGEAELTGIANFIKFGPEPEQMFMLAWHCGADPESPIPMEEDCAIWERGPNPPPPPPPGHCTIYKTVDSHTSANDTTFSGFEKKMKPKLWASWPASSPWVTAVGATRFVGQEVGGEEMASDQFGSGGGFSDPSMVGGWDQSNADYQKDMVAAYLKNSLPADLPPADAFDPTGRATPDVGALGEGFNVIVGGHMEPVGGTSASSPTFAGLVSLLNEARLAAGKPEMGFLNPFLYKHADDFFDVVKGSNKVGRGGEPLPYGWNCTKGWDPATGLGTPLFDKLLKDALA